MLGFVRFRAVRQVAKWTLFMQYNLTGVSHQRSIQVTKSRGISKEPRYKDEAMKRVVTILTGSCHTSPFQQYSLLMSPKDRYLHPYPPHSSKN